MLRLSRPRLLEIFKLTRRPTVRICHKPKSFHLSLTPSTRMEQLCERLSAQVPCFKVPQESIRILKEPSEFFEELKLKTANAKKRIILSSLYIGTEPKPIELMRTLEQALLNNPELVVTILLDCLRGTRNTSTKPDEVNSSLTLLTPLLKQFPAQLECYFYHTPKLAGIMKRLLPERYNELLGVHHIKLYMFDDDVLISGANLSEQYFTNRQDRYMWIDGSKEISNFYKTLLSTIASFSYFPDAQGQLVFKEDVPNPSKDPMAFNLLAKKAIDDMMLLYKSDPIYELSDDEVLVFPTVQIGPSDITYDLEVTKTLLTTLNHESNLYLSSPYFNFTDEYQSLILNHKSKNIGIIVASPQANGFYQGKGVSGMIPWAYNNILKKFYNNLTQDQSISLREYDREAWTFHGKGLWAIFPEAEREVYLTMIGSSNFGFRSVHRDVESQLVILSRSKHFGDKLKVEKDAIFETSHPVEPQLFIDREVNESIFLPILVPLAKKFM